MRYLSTLIVTCFLFGTGLSAQKENYADSLLRFRETYIEEHEVIRDNERSLLRFFPVDKKYCVPARLEKIEEAPWFLMETSGTKKKTYRVYGILHFTVNDKTRKLHIYQSKDLMNDSAYADYLFIPFTDKTSGADSYDNGRYIDLRIPELEKGDFRLDFNKAYNPYCAYVSNKYNCPVPPRENELDIAIPAGEMKYGKDH